MTKRMMGENFYAKDLLKDNKLAEAGDHSYYDRKINILSWGEGSKLYIGKYCSIAYDVTFFLGGNHRHDWVTTYPFPALEVDWPEAKNIKGHPFTKGDIVVGNDVWVGRGATIMSGVNIGDGAVIAAQAVVTKDVPDYGIVVGNPSQLIKYRFSKSQIKKFKKIEWWNWPEEKVASNLKLLCATPEGFLEKYTTTKMKKIELVIKRYMPTWLKNIIKKAIKR